MLEGKRACPLGPCTTEGRPPSALRVVRPVPVIGGGRLRRQQPAGTASFGRSPAAGGGRVPGDSGAPFASSAGAAARDRSDPGGSLGLGRRQAGRDRGRVAAAGVARPAGFAGSGAGDRAAGSRSRRQRGRHRPDRALPSPPHGAARRRRRRRCRPAPLLPRTREHRRRRAVLVGRDVAMVLEDLPRAARRLREFLPRIAQNRRGCGFPRREEFSGPGARPRRPPGAASPA